MEVRQCFSARRIPIFVFLTLIAIFLVVQESELSPLFVVCFAVFAILESQFNNILFRSPHELEALSMFPYSWRSIVFAKNLATVMLTMIVAGIVSMAVLYFSPKPFEATFISEGFLYASTLIFPLLHLGNNESIRTPRKYTGWRIDDIVQAAGMFLFLLVLSFPYVVFTFIINISVLNIPYACGAAWYWYTHSLPGTALKIEQEKSRLCQTQ